MSDNNRPRIYHYIIEMFDLDRRVLLNTRLLQKYARNFADQAHLNIVNTICHCFDPSGATLVFVLSASHLSLHTWPENNYLHIDLLSCQHILEEGEIRRIASQSFYSKKINVIKLRYTD